MLTEHTFEGKNLVAELEKEGISRDLNRQRPWHCYKVLSRQIWCSRESSNAMRTVGSLLTASSSESVKGNGAASVIQCGWGSPVAEPEGVGLWIRCNAYATLNLPPSTT
jgi:hypothetical protein